MADSTRVPEHPNLVVVHCHDLGRHLGCYGRDVETPNADALASEGVRFENAFCTAPQCSPSRASLWTGQYPHEVGMLGLAHRGWDRAFAAADPSTLPEYLPDAYETRLFGFQHLAEDPGALGYDETWTTESGALAVGEAVADALPELADGGPFLAVAGFTEPHRPYDRDGIEIGAGERYDPASVGIPPHLPDDPRVREDVARLNELVTSTTDRGLGRVVEAVDEAGVADETLVVFTTDHGLALPRAKGSCYDPGLEVALLARGPGVGGGRVEDALLSNVDLTPTLLDYAGAEVPDASGRSLRGALEAGDDGPGSEGRERVFAELTYHDRYHPTRAVRTADYKYVRNFDHGQAVYLPSDVFDTPAGRAVRGAYYTETRPEEECYHLPGDPHERDSVASEKDLVQPCREYFWMDAPDEAHPDHADAIADLRSGLHAWMERTDDPLLSGAVAPPAREAFGPFAEREHTAGE